MSKKDKDKPALADEDAVPSEGVKSSSVENTASAPVEEKEPAPDYYEQLLRLRAEFDNYRKRMERERAALRSWAKEEILVKQISILDIMTQALNSARSARNIDVVVSGLEMIIKEFEKMLAEEGVSSVDTSDAFDPARHEAVETVEDECFGDGTIKEVVQKGYAMGERLIRPARVKIVKNIKTGDGRHGTGDGRRETGDGF